jgi:cob(I)alamin adenosyltransferase
MINLTKIYTKTGDEGTTSLGDMSRTSKNDPRIEAYATVDEANSSIGVVLAIGNIINEDIRSLLLKVQNDLFDLGADLCNPIDDSVKTEPLRVLQSQITYLEQQIDKYNHSLAPLKSFILPSGTPASALLHVARTITRRAERETWFAIDTFKSSVNPATAIYLNRLSDLLFVLARFLNKELGDQLWVPGGNRK